MDHPTYDECKYCARAEAEEARQQAYIAAGISALKALANGGAR